MTIHIVLLDRAGYVIQKWMNTRAVTLDRTSSADLPLHGGRVPSWMASRMALLGAVISHSLAARSSAFFRDIHTLSQQIQARSSPKRSACRPEVFF